jgi:hypothetical protein
MTTEDTENTEKATPETDARTYVPLLGASTVPANFARKLERERDEARGLLASEKITRDHIIKRGIEMQKERDEARADAVTLADILSGLELRSTEELARLEQERNEEQAVADELASVAARCLGWHDHECPDAAIKIAAAVKRWKKMRREL